MEVCGSVRRAAQQAALELHARIWEEGENKDAAPKCSCHNCKEMHLNNKPQGGGFCGSRTKPLAQADWSDYDGLALRVKGDGQIFKLNIKTEEQVRAVRGHAGVLCVCVCVRV